MQLKNNKTLFSIFLFFSSTTLSLSQQVTMIMPSYSDEFWKSDSLYSVYEIDSQTKYLYKKPSAFQHFTLAPADVYDYTVEAFQRENLSTYLGVAAMTAFLLVYDQDIVDESQRFGRRIGVKGDNNVKTVAKIAGFPIQLPTDFSSSLYFIGDGWTHTALTSSFLTAGLIWDDTRALQTASQLAEGLLAVTIITQFLKHITGRQSPFKSTEPGGRWDFFPNQVKYHKNVPAYDAYPSGHLAAAMMTVTVISENYPEYKFIKPFGYSLMTVLALQMLNNGVHWASDYPLAVVMGSAIGDLVVQRNRTVVKKNPDELNLFDSIHFGVGILRNNQIGINISYNLD